MSVIQGRRQTAYTTLGVWEIGTRLSDVEKQFIDKR